MKRSLFFIGVALVPFLSTAAAPDTRLVGAFDSISCAEAYTDSRAQFSNNLIEFHEASCSLTNPVLVRGMTDAVLFDANCSGEGEQWTIRLMIMPGYGGNAIVVQSGQTTTYKRCD
jgi:hypothetical protein